MQISKPLLIKMNVDSEQRHGSNDSVHSIPEQYVCDPSEVVTS